MKRPIIQDFLSSPMTGEEIEARSFEIIDKEAPAHNFTPGEWQVVRRMIHTVGDFSIMDRARFSPDAIDSAVAALREGRAIFADSNMIRAGISLPRLRAINPGYDRESIICHIADEDVARLAREGNLPRSLPAMRKAGPYMDGAIALFGNAPLALLEMNRLVIEGKARPALVVAMPVGFVHVEESKEEAMSLGVPFIALSGRRGGSPLAVSVLHALCSIASAEDRAVTKGTAINEAREKRAVIILGHGSRATGAVSDMEKVVMKLRARLDYEIIESCQMSGKGELFPQAFDRCVKKGATFILVLPYFLHKGIHLIEDVPEMMREKAASYPGIKVVLGSNLGFDEAIVDVVMTRIRESEGFADIRTKKREALATIPLGLYGTDRCAGNVKKFFEK